MPYFLVSHTCLVEAEDETAAAAKAYEKIASSEAVSFSVKSDEQPPKQVRVATRRVTETAPIAISTAQEPEEMRGAVDRRQPVDEPVPQQASPKASSSGMLCGSAVGAIVVFAAIVHFFL